MKFTLLFKTALEAMSANKGRTALTVLGVVIGIASVIIVFAAGQGLSNIVLSQVEMFGTDIIEVEIKIPSNKSGAAQEQQNAANLVQGVQITTFTLDDIEDIEDHPNIGRAYGGVIGQEAVSFQGNADKVFIWGVSAPFIDIDQSEIEYGRFYTESEDNSLAKVIVLGSKVKKSFFGDSDPLGRLVKMRNDKYRVIGVMEERGAMFGMDFDDALYVPLQTLQKRVMGINHVSYAVFEVNDLALADITAEDIRVLLRINHKIPPPETAYAGAFGAGIEKDDFRVVTMEEMLELMTTITSALTVLLLAIVAISLVVGGVGITNVMYVIVGERTREIGLRKAVGATRRDIMWQFLVESILITLLGGVVGTALGVLMAFGISFGASYAGIDWAFDIPLRAFIVSLGFSLIFGVFFGVYPARKASKLDPIVALRSE